MWEITFVWDMFEFLMKVGSGNESPGWKFGEVAKVEFWVHFKYQS